jgi:hypothetical protein
MDLPISPRSWFRRPRLVVVPDEPAPSWQRTLALCDTLRDEAANERECEQIDAAFSRQVP